MRQDSAIEGAHQIAPSELDRLTSPRRSARRGRPLPSPVRRRWRSRLTLGALALLATLVVGGSAQAQTRAILWRVIPAEGATVDPEVVEQLFRELLAGAEDAQHLVGIPDLAEYIRQNGVPAPGCLAGLSNCGSPDEAVAEELRLDLIATVRVFGDGKRMSLTLRSTRGEATRTLHFEGEHLRETAFQIVTDFVGSTALLTVTSRPTGARVFVNGDEVGETPFQGELPAGICDLRIELEGYVGVDQTIELRPNQARLVDIDLNMASAGLLVESTTPNAVIYVDGEPMGEVNSVFRVSPGFHTIRVEADGYVPEEREVDLPAGTDSEIAANLRETPETIRAREMGYIYDRPFYLSGGFRFAGTRSSFFEGSGDIDGVSYTVDCPAATGGECAAARVPVNLAGVTATLGYAFKVLEVQLVTVAYGASQVGGSAGDGRILTLRPDDAAAAGRDELAGVVDGVSRLEVRPLGLGARILFSDTWSIFAHGGVGWYKEFFDVDARPAVEEVGDFTRDGFLWQFDVGARYHLNDTIFFEAAFALGNEFGSDPNYDAADVVTAFSASIGLTWQDVLGIDRLFGGGPPAEIDEPEEAP